jgi:multiple antibiotic resistance protein
MAFAIPSDLFFSISAGIVTLFVILDPIGVVPFFQNLTRGYDPVQRRGIAKMSVVVATALLLAFALVGNLILSLLGISLYDFEIAGGLLLLIFAIRDALFTEPLGASESSAVAEKLSPEQKLSTVAIIPIATPLLAGPGSLTIVMLLSKQDYGILISTVAILVDCTIAWFALRLSDRLAKHFGTSGLLIIGKVMDILMAAIAVSFLVSGIHGIGF